MDSEYHGSRLLLRWREVRAMGLGRAAWRAGYELRKRLGLVSRDHGPDPDDPAAVLAELTTELASEEDLLAHFRDGGAGTFFFENADRAAYVDAVRRLGADATAVAAADEVCEHRFRLLGQTFDFAEGEIDWHHEPQSSGSWSRVPWHRVDIRSPRRLGDVKFTWELNRHQFWPTLGRAYWLTGDEKYPREWVDQFRSWSRQNPPGVGVNWASNLEHALRIVSWWMSVRLMIHSPSVTGKTLTRLIGLLVRKARHIVADLAYSRINMANNHLIGDAMGLAVLGLAVPELRDAARWRRTGLEMMWAEAMTQIHADGASFESSASYHRFVLQFYVLAIALCDRASVPVPPDVRQRVERMADFVAAAARCDGTLPQFGDFDSGVAYRLNEAPVQDFRPVLSTAAVLFARGDFKRAGGGLDAETLWLLGPSAAEAFESLPDDPPPAPRRAFPRGGLFIDRDAAGRRHLMIRNGPFTSHTHADLLSVCLFAAGRGVLIDSGTYTYNGPWPWRTAFRTTRAHNTVTVDSQGQALAHRAFRWLFAPKAVNHFFAADGPLVFDGRHSGYLRLGVTHRRILLGIRDDAWLCLDLLEGTGEHTVAVHWHLAADILASELPGEPGTVVGRCGRQEAVTLSPAATAELAVEILRGDDDRPAGWYSPEYGVKTPACEIMFAATARMPLCVATVIGLGGPPLRPQPPVLAEDNVTVQLGDVVHVEYLLHRRAAFQPGQTVELARIRRGEGPPDILHGRCLRPPR